MNNIAVTGATGFVGGFVAEYLKARGYKVYKFGRKNKKDIIHWDISIGMYSNTLPIDIVIHCAADVSDWSSYKKSYSVNVHGTKNVLASFPSATLFIYISSASVYSPYCTQKTITEATCVGGKGLNNYGITKLLGESEVERSEYLSKVILRPHIIYGPGDTTIAPRIRKAIKHNFFIVPGDGKNHISFTHVENLSHAILQSITYRKNGVSIYNIADGVSPRFYEALLAFKKLNKLNFKILFISRKFSFILGAFLECIYKLFKSNVPPPITPYIVHQLTHDYILDITKAKKEIRYSPTKKYNEDFCI